MAKVYNGCKASLYIGTQRPATIVACQLAQTPRTIAAVRALLRRFVSYIYGTLDESHVLWPTCRIWRGGNPVGKGVREIFRPVGAQSKETCMPAAITDTRVSNRISKVTVAG